MVEYELPLKVNRKMIFNTQSNNYVDLYNNMV